MTKRRPDPTLDLDFGDRPGGDRPGHQPTPPHPSSIKRPRFRRPPAKPGALAQALAHAKGRRDEP
jgi:hypothetical protein